MNTLKNDIPNTLTRLNVSVKILQGLLDKLIEINKNDTNWFIFSEKIIKKYISQALTLQHIFSYDMYVLGKDGIQERFIDLSSIAALTRVQMETYAVFYHLFIDSCSWEEKIIRFRLWQLDGLKTVQSYRRPDDKETQEKLFALRKEVDEITEIVKNFSYFKNLEQEKQDYLLKYSAWRFTDESLKNINKNKRRLSINLMIMRTGLKESHFEDWYSFTSTHAHTNYWSVVQNNTLSQEEILITEYVALMQSTFMTCFFIKDFYKIYEPARNYFDSLDKKEQEFINSFNNSGRTQQNYR